MEPYRPDRVVRFLTFAVSASYYMFWAAAVLVFVVIPLVRLAAGDRLPSDMTFTYSVPVTVAEPQPALVSGWDSNDRRIELDEVRGVLDIPMSLPPLWLQIVNWAGSVFAGALILLFLHHLRRLFQRVRDGRPFATENAIRLRWLGILLLANHLFVKVFMYWMSVEVKQSLLVRDNIALGTYFEIDEPIVFTAFVLIALAEIFRRGAVLEDEQSLVV